MRSRRRTGSSWLWIPGVLLLMGMPPPSQAQGGETKATQPAVATNAAGLVQTIVSVEPDTWTVEGKAEDPVSLWMGDDRAEIRNAKSSPKGPQGKEGGQ